MRFCERNLSKESSKMVLDYNSENNADLIIIETFHCLGNCSLCNQGPYCTLNDFVFLEKDPERLNKKVNKILSKIRIKLNDYEEGKK